MNEWYSTYNKKSNKGNKKGRIIGIIIILAAIAAAVIYMIFGSSVSFVYTKTDNDGTSVYSFGNGENFFDDSGDTNDYPSDFKDFFDGYYTTTTTDATNVDLPRYEGELDFDLELESTTKQELTLGELFEQCSPSIVSVSASLDGETDSYWGSGIIVSADGLILTNTHVITDCKSANIQLSDGMQYEAKLVGADSVSDLALLKIDADYDLPYAEFADVSAVQVGDEVAAIGSPLGPTFRNTLTNGIISAINRDLPYNGHSMTLLQTNTALNEGNSGGALFNMYGQVIGVTNMKMMSTLSSIEGIGFAIPSSTVETVTNNLIQYGYVPRTYIGITVGAIPDKAAKNYDLPSGVYVSAVNEGSGAYDAGIEVGDIVVRVNGIDIKSADEINVIKDKLNVGDTMIFSIYRDGEITEVPVVLKESPVN